MHTRFSDGSGTHRKIGQAALQSGLDVVITTDHNVLVKGMDSIYQDGERRVLMIVSEEVHDQARDPQKNHLLAIGAEKELSTFARDPQILIDQVKMNGGLSFIAHPNDHAMKAFGEGDISWVDWDVHGFTGIELWNGLSEMKDRAHNKLQAVFLALFPQFLAEGPLPETLAKWDELLISGQKVVAVGGSDAHALHMSLGPLHREIFPYEFHFQAINNHLLTPGPISGDMEADKAMVLAALAQGHSFIGYDLPASTRGFRFSAQGQDGTAGMGDEIALGSGVT
ncbi:MAG: hypothetical protein HGA53_08320, partial [Anaerolineaceae bacterium]|nr:hypothetical protein [Anaerolineaceae bacterium]